MSSPSGGPGGFMSKLPQTDSTTSTTPPSLYPSSNRAPPSSPADIESELLVDLTTNPYKQYRSPQNVTLQTPYTNPMDQYRASPYITGRGGENSSHDSRDSVFSSIVVRDEIDSIPPAALFLGRIGQQRPKQLEKFIRSTNSQREFFEQSGFDDDMLKYTIMPSAVFAGALGVLTTPFERARALVQANSASIAALQDANPLNMVAKPVPNENNPLFAENNTTNTPSTNPESSTNKTTSKSSSEMKTDVNKKVKPTSSVSKKALLSSMIQPERKDSFSKFFQNNPNSTKAPILRPNPYDIYSRRQVLLFEEEYAKIANEVEYRGLSGFEKALKVKESNPHLKHIHISSYDIFNHHLEHGISSSRPLPSEVALDMMTGANKDVNAVHGNQRTRLRPMEMDIFPQNQSDFHRGFHRYYAEPRYTNIRTALKSMYQHSGFLGCFKYSSIPFLGRVIPFLFLIPFYRAWKDWMTNVHGTDSVFQAEFQLAETHSRSQLLTMLALYPLYAMLTSVHVNKTALYPNYPLNKSPELQSWKERFTTFHLANDTFAKYTTKTPAAMQNEKTSIFGKIFNRNTITEVEEKTLAETIASTPKYHEDSANTGVNKVYRNKQVSFLESMLKREMNKSRTKLIVEQLMAVEGPRSFIRGIRPALLATLLYYTIFVTTFTLSGTLTIEFMHEFRSKMKPAPPQGHPHDINLEVMKALVPFTTATLAAQYAAYPLTTIRQYVTAADSPGYVTFNKNANALPHGIAVDQYRLPFRLVEPVKPRHQFRIASHEIRRQYGLRGFWHGASIIPFVRIPQAILVGGAMFYGLHSQWPAMNQLIDTQHFFNNVPPVL